MGAPLKLPRWIPKPGRTRLPKPYPIHPDDTFFVSYPRSGSSWLRRLIAIALDPHAAEQLRQNINAVIPDMYAVGRRLSEYARPRMIKSHELCQPLYPKVIYLYRDGRDVAISYYNFYRTIKKYPGTLDEFLELFLRGDVEFGRWDSHVRSWVLREPAGPFLVVAYEDLHQNTRGVVAAVLDFLGYSAPDEAIQRAIEECTFDRHQEQVKNISPHYTKGYRGGVGGKAGHWQETLSDQQTAMLWDAFGDTLNALGYRRRF
jgi:hypothetical protein